MTTIESLYAGICEHPECDTRRLAFADYLDGLDPVRVPCPDCGGRGWLPLSNPRARRAADDCPRCRCVGTVLDTSAHDLAEYVRLQCELVSAGSGLGVCCQTRSTRWCRGCTARTREVGLLLAREKELEAAHPEWRRAKCAECEGKSGEEVTEADGVNKNWWRCRVCNGTGDLFTEGNHYGTVPAARPVTLRRGFPHSVECEAADVWREEREEARDINGDGYASYFVPTEWALAVVRQTPVVEFRVNLEPTLDEGGYEWYGLPNVLNTVRTKRTFATAAEAKTALYQEIGHWVRKKAYEVRT